ncbi:MAG TPA: acyl-CoA dehydrogenase family protein [Candidatus Saccharimonadales bacterium]|nr:acyl-CoA dehydrogenase family protein [Candidatus Saccharimonadales bacterium]
MNFDLTDEQLEIRSFVRELAHKEWGPACECWEQAGGIPDAVMAQLAELGFMGLAIPEEYGGNPYDPVSTALVIEEMAHVSASLAICVAVHNSVGTWPIVTFGTDEQKRRYLPPMAKGMLGAFCLSEPDAGSDASHLATVAVRDGDHYVLNGAKNWVTNGARAGLFTVLACTDRAKRSHGVSAFLVERDAPGLVLGKKEDKMGLRASDTLALTLEDCRVPADSLLGAEGDGFKIAMTALDGGRIGVGAQALGVAQAAFERAVRYSKVRQAFGSPISDLEAIQWMIADMARRLEAARWLTYHAAWLRGEGLPFSRQAAMAKLYASEAATFVTHRAIQVHGGYGYVREYLVERFYRDARVMEIYEGTSEIQRLVIARSVLKEGVAPMA